MYFLLLLCILPLYNIVKVYSKVLRKKDKHVKSERIDMSVTKMLKYAAMATAAGIMYPKVKTKIKKADQERKKIMFKAEKKIKEP